MKPANLFRIEGERINSLDEFFQREKDNVWRQVLYYAEKFESSRRDPLVFTGKQFIEVSFKDTDIINVRFIRCSFKRCLFIGARLQNCEFINCTFEETNTSKVKIDACLIDPRAFDQNFNLKDDTNIAIDLYHSLYKNASREHQPDHALESLFRMKIAETRHLDSQRRRGLLTTRNYLQKKIRYITHGFVSGYGLRTSRVFRLLIIAIAFFSTLNYIARHQMFDGHQRVESFMDSIYFTCVTITTLGFGDIVPTTSLGRMFVAVQAVAGIVVVSLFLSAVANRALKSQ